MAAVRPRRPAAAACCDNPDSLLFLLSNTSTRGGGRRMHSSAHCLSDNSTDAPPTVTARHGAPPTSKPRRGAAGLRRTLSRTLSLVMGDNSRNIRQFKKSSSCVEFRSTRAAIQTEWPLISRCDRLVSRRSSLRRACGHHGLTV